MARIIFYSAQAINILFVIFVLFFERKESTRRFVWIMLLLFFPVGGMVLYILFSGNFFTGTKRMHEVKQTAQQLTKEVRREQKATLTQSPSNIPNPVIKEFLPLITMNLMEGKSLLVSTDTAILYTRGEDFFNDLCQELESAKVSIFMEYFIFHKDNIGKRIMEILCRKAREGVDVKLIYDDLGSIATPRRFFRQLNKAGGEARPFFQIRIGLPLTLNYRNHRKLTVIDSDRAFIGGINIGDEYENKNKRFKPKWRDTVVRLTGSSVLTLQINFLSDWYSIDAWNKHTKGIEEAKKYFPSSFTDFFVRADVGGGNASGEIGGDAENYDASGRTGGGNASGEIGGDAGNPDGSGRTGGGNASREIGGDAGNPDGSGRTGGGNASGEIGGDAGNPDGSGRTGGGNASGEIGGDAGNPDGSGKTGGGNASREIGGDAGNYAASGRTGGGNANGKIGGDAENSDASGKTGGGNASGEIGGDAENPDGSGRTGGGNASGEIGGDAENSDASGRTGSGNASRETGGDAGNPDASGRTGGGNASREIGGDAENPDASGKTGGGNASGEIGGDAGNYDASGKTGGGNASRETGGDAENYDASGRTGGGNASGEIGGDAGNPDGNKGLVSYSIQKQEVSAKEKKEHSLKFRKSFLESLAGGKAIPTQIVTAGPNEKHKANIEDTFIRMIMSARKNIFIQTPYFTPDEGFYTVLKLAAYTGIKVRIMIPSQWDKFFMKAASYEFAREMCAEGVEFFLYPGFIHSKMMTVDGKISSIGTTNIDVRSFRLLFEENAIFYDKNFTAECERIFEEDMELCRPVTKEDFDKRFILKRAWGSFCKLFSPLL